jgi:hypothetical protein
LKQSPVAGEEAALLPGLAALNGEILSADSDRVSGAPAMNPQPTQLSGADFMSALAAGRLGARGQDSSNLSGDSGGGGQFGGQAGKGNFRALDSIKKPASLPGREDMLILGGVEPLRTGDYHVIQPTQVEGRVTQGAMTRPRLTSESLLNMTNGIGAFATQGGGEMRVRLKPDNLGELHVRVSTRGNDVRLMIQATDEKARKILEESMPHLKDKLASQNLNLGRVEVSTLAHSASGSGLRQDDQGQNQNPTYQQHSMNDWLGQDQQGKSGGSQGQWRDYDANWETDLRAARPVRPSTAGLTAAASSARSSELESGRLDVRA